MDEAKTQILSQALTAAMDMYKEHSRIISLLDDKAQKTSGIAGIFLAAGLAYLKADSLKALGEAVHFAGFVTLSLAIALLLACIFYCGMVLWVRRQTLPPDTKKLFEMCEIILAQPGGPDDETRENHYRDMIRSWNVAVAAQTVTSMRKSKLLHIAQVLMFAAMTCVVILLGEVIVHAWVEPVKHVAPKTVFLLWFI